jgi:hypothetical protein
MSEDVGRVVARFRLWNVLDESRIQSGELKPMEEECLVDTGATMVVLNLPRESKKMQVTFADGRQELREVVYGLRVEFLGRLSNCRAVIEPGRITALIGQIPLEEMDLLVDCKNGQVVGRDPSGANIEIAAAR